MKSPQMPFDGEYLTLRELAERWESSYATLRNYRAYFPHRLPKAHKVRGRSGRIYYALADVERFEANKMPERE